MARKKRRRSRKSKVHWSLRAVWFVLKWIGKGIYYFFKYLGIGIVKGALWFGNQCKAGCMYLKEKHEARKAARIEKDIEESSIKEEKSEAKTKEADKKEEKVVEEKKKPKKKRPRKRAQYDDFRLVHSYKGSWKKFEEKLFENKSLIGIILGARGSGKTGLGLRLLENMYAQTKRKCFAIGFEGLPRWINVVEKIEDIENDSVVLVDEGGILFSSRESMSESNKFLSELILIARHKDLSIIFISQNSANIEINAIRQADYLLLKPSSLLQLDFERKKIKNIYEEVSEDFKRYKRTKGLLYVYTEHFRGFVSNPLPGFWTQDVSKGFKNK